MNHHLITSQISVSQLVASIQTIIFIYSFIFFPCNLLPFQYRQHTSGQLTRAIECYLSRRSNHRPHPDMRSLGKRRSVSVMSFSLICVKIHPSQTQSHNLPAPIKSGVNSPWLSFPLDRVWVSPEGFCPIQTTLGMASVPARLFCSLETGNHK